MGPVTDVERAFEELQVLRANVADSPGAPLSDELGAVARTYRLWQENALEFVRFLARFDEDVTARLELWQVENREGFNAFLDEVDRLLHNYLAAASTLRDHTRCLWQQYPPSDPALVAEYDERVRELFAESPMAQFVQGLRNFSMHSKLPLVQGRFTWSVDGGEHQTVVLPKASLLEWDRWNVLAREFIESRHEFDLRAVLAEYSAVVDDFNQWFGAAFVKGHLAAFEDLNERKVRFNEALDRSGLRSGWDAKAE